MVELSGFDQPGSRGSRTLCGAPRGRKSDSRHEVILVSLLSHSKAAEGRVTQKRTTEGSRLRYSPARHLSGGPQRSVATLLAHRPNDLDGYKPLV